MSMTRLEAFQQINEFRDFAEGLESALRSRQRLAEANGWCCIYLQDGISQPPRQVHIHITAELLAHCADALADSITDKAIAEGKSDVFRVAAKNRRADSRGKWIKAVFKKGTQLLFWSAVGLVNLLFMTGVIG